MKRTLLLWLLLFAQLCVGQTKDLIKVAGTKCSLIPPDGFVTAKTFAGLQDSESGASIMINELPAPYQSMVDGFTADALKARGMTLVSKETIDFNKFKATLIELTQVSNDITYLKQMLVFGDEKQTVLVNGIYPETSRPLEKKIKEALLSTVYNPLQNVDPFDAVTFTIVVDQEFKFTNYLSGILLYTLDGQTPTEKPMLMVGNSIGRVSIQDPKQFAVERLKTLPGGDRNVVKQINDITIDNLKGFEIIADGKTKDNMPQLLYQVVLFSNEGNFYYIILGQASENFEKYLEKFKRMSKTLKRK